MKHLFAVATGIVTMNGRTIGSFLMPVDGHCQLAPFGYRGNLFQDTGFTVPEESTIGVIMRRLAFAYDLRNLVCGALFCG